MQEKKSLDEILNEATTMSAQKQYEIRKNAVKKANAILNQIEIIDFLKQKKHH